MIEQFHPIQTNALPKKDKLKNFAWCVVNSTVFRFTPSHFSVFRKYRVWLTRLFGSKIDYSCNLHPTSKIEYPWNISMGQLSSLGEHCWIYAMDKIMIGEKSCIGKDVQLLTGSHDVNSNCFNLVIRPINIGSAVWIATSATVLQGVTIGEGAVVGATASVYKDVEPWTVVGGNPAKFLKRRIIDDNKNTK